MELWDGYFVDGSLANRDLVRGEAIPPGLYHLVSDVLVRHIDGDYLLMRRSPNKESYAGFYEATAGGSALKGENSLICAKRELFEETGIVAYNFIEIGRYVSNNTIYYSYLCITDCDKSSIILQKGETDLYKWVSEKEFIDFINSNEVIDTQKLRYKDFLIKKGYFY